MCVCMYVHMYVATYVLVLVFSGCVLQRSDVHNVLTVVLFSCMYVVLLMKIC